MFMRGIRMRLVMNSKGQKLVAPASMPLFTYYTVGNCWESIS